MDLRSGTRTGPVAQLSGPAKEGFEEGVAIIFSQWTALVLAVENQWGGSESASKADYLIEDILEWFYKKKGEAGEGSLLQAAAMQLALLLFRLHCSGGVVLPSLTAGSIHVASVVHAAVVQAPQSQLQSLSA